MVHYKVWSRDVTLLGVTDKSGRFVGCCKALINLIDSSELVKSHNGA